MLLYLLLKSHHLLKKSLGLFEVLSLYKLHESVQDQSELFHVHADFDSIGYEFLNFFGSID